MVDPQLTDELLQRLLTRMDHLDFSVTPQATSKVERAVERLDDGEVSVDATQKTIGSIPKSRRALAEMAEGLEPPNPNVDIEPSSLTAGLAAGAVKFTEAELSPPQSRHEPDSAP